MMPGFCPRAGVAEECWVASLIQFYLVMNRPWQVFGVPRWCSITSLLVKSVA